tara:strand:- start:447 stop:1082 length:636 start_codon:yes stop_codon:yes gene_type:complete
LKKNKISKDWMNKQRRDIYFKKSKAWGFKSRSAFKLLEMDNKFKFLKKNILLLDLGSSPGGWSQVASRVITNGKILAVDIKSMEKIKNVDFINEDFSKEETHKKIISYFQLKIDVVLSDMAVSTSGNKNLDSYQTGELCLRSMDLASKILNQEGVFLSKLFMGSIFNEIKARASKYFKKVINYKPLSSKKESKEIYIYCKGVLKPFNFHNL